MLDPRRDDIPHLDQGPTEGNPLDELLVILHREEVPLDIIIFDPDLDSGMATGTVEERTGEESERELGLRFARGWGGGDFVGSRLGQKKSRST